MSSARLEKHTFYVPNVTYGNLNVTYGNRVSSGFNRFCLKLINSCFEFKKYLSAGIVQNCLFLQNLKQLEIIFLP